MEGKYCKSCDTVKPYEDFYKQGNNYQARCKVCYNDKHKSKHKKLNRMDAFEGNPNDLEGAKNTLIAMGYDLNRDIHEQFMERVSSKYGKF